MNHWDSVKQLIGVCKRLDFVHLWAQCELVFIWKFLQSPNIVLSTSANVHLMSYAFITLCEEFDVCISNSRSRSKLRNVLETPALAHPGGPGKRAIKQLWWW